MCLLRLFLKEFEKFNLYNFLFIIYDGKITSYVYKFYIKNNTYVYIIILGIKPLYMIILLNFVLHSYIINILIIHNLFIVLNMNVTGQ